MYPNKILSIVTLFEIFFVGGIIAALLVFISLMNRKKIPVKVQNYYLYLVIAAVAVGYVFSFLFQGVYIYFQTGEFKLQGITFIGGLIGGAATFLIAYKLTAKQEHKEFFPLIFNAAPVSIALGHAFGRLGCYTAGCCYGKVTESTFFGVQFPGSVGAAGLRYPTQMYEAIFLFIIFGVFAYFYYKDKRINMPLYLVSYGIFRFLIEFVRGDDVERGEFIIRFLSPSQFWSVFMVIGGAVLWYYMAQKAKKTAVSNISDTDNTNVKINTDVKDNTDADN